MPKKTLVSVIIPVKELTYYLLHENLPKLTKQSYKKYEIIVLPNEHAQYDLTLLNQYKNLRIIPTGKITRPAEKRDIGVKQARGEIIAFLDDDAYPDRYWLENAVEIFKKDKVEAVCGPGILPQETNIWEKIFDEVLKTWIGAGEYSYRFSKQPKRFVTDYPSMNFLIVKKVFLKLGGFNSDYWPGEDSKLCNDLIEKEKGSILYSPEVVVYHHRRNNLKGYLKQHASYGFHRGAFFAHGDKNSRKIEYLVPTVFVSYLIALVFYVIIVRRIDIFFLPFLIYGLFEGYLLIKSLFSSKNIIISIGSVLILFLTHIVYGLMFIKGLRKGFNKKISIYD